MKEIIDFPAAGTNMVQPSNYSIIQKDMSNNQFSPKRNDETMLVPLASRRENTFMQDDNTINPSSNNKFGHKSYSSKNMLLLNPISLKPVATIEQNERIPINKTKAKLGIPYSPNLLKMERSGAVDTAILDPVVRLKHQHYSLNDNFILGKPDVFFKNSKESLVSKDLMNHTCKVQRTQTAAKQLAELLPTPGLIISNCENNSSLSSIDRAELSDHDNEINHSHSRILESCRNG